MLLTAADMIPPSCSPIDRCVMPVSPHASPTATNFAARSHVRQLDTSARDRIRRAGRCVWSGHAGKIPRGREPVKPSSRRCLDTSVSS
jgi:hypothetical protein